MQHFLVFFLSFSLAFISQAKRFQVEFTNTQANVCVVYLEDSFIGKIEKGEVFTTKLTEGVHHLSFVVLEPNGEYYTYLRDVEVKEDHQFLLLANDSGYIHLEKHQGVNPLVLEAISHLPILSADNFNLMLLKLENFEFENSRFELIKREISKCRLTTDQLLQFMAFIQPQIMKSEIASIAYQHLLDKENYPLMLSALNKATAEKLMQEAATVNQFL